MSRRFDPFPYLLPLVGIGLVLLIWTFLSHTVALDLPSPLKTWDESKDYVLRPFFKDGEMNQGIARFALLSLVRVAKGFLVAIVAGTLLGYLLGLSVSFYQAFDPVIQVLRPISPLAWLPLKPGYSAVASGICFVPFHWGRSMGFYKCANNLTLNAYDPVSKYNSSEITTQF